MCRSLTAGSGRARPKRGAPPLSLAFRPASPSEQGRCKEGAPLSYPSRGLAPLPGPRAPPPQQKGFHLRLKRLGQQFSEEGTTPPEMISQSPPHLSPSLATIKNLPKQAASLERLQKNYKETVHVCILHSPKAFTRLLQRGLGLLLISFHPIWRMQGPDLFSPQT